MCDAAAAAAGGDERGAARGQLERCLGEHRGDDVVERRTQRRRKHGHTRFGESLHQFVVLEELLDVRPRVADRDDHAPARLLGTAREAQHPLDRVVAVVVDLLHRLRGDRRERRVGRLGERRVQLDEVDGCHELPRDRVGEVAVRLLEEPRVAPLGLVAPVGEVVFAATRRRSGVVQERAGVADEVEGDVAEGDVLLELGGAGDPHAELLGEHERVVAEPQRVLRDIRGCNRADAVGTRAGELLGEREPVDGDVAVHVAVRVEIRAAHRCFTPSLFV